MKNIIVALLILFVLAPGAEAGKLKDIAGKVGHYVKKAVVLPLYVIGGGASGAVLWYHFGGSENAWSDAFAGRSR